MKIALIGNMNNNHFAMMRYFRDLGADAHLFLYEGDGVGSLEHFNPEDDTFNIEKWEMFIHQTKITNSFYQALPQPWKFFFTTLYNLRYAILKKGGYIKYATNDYIKATLSGYDKIICNGYGPGILGLAKIKIDVFNPYCIGVEGIESGSFNKRKNSLLSLLSRKARKKQIEGIKKIKTVISPDEGVTTQVLLGIGKTPIHMAMPMVYLEKELPRDLLDENIKLAINFLGDKDFSILMHSRLAWTTKGGDEAILSKNNHWLLYALKEIKMLKPHIKLGAIVAEYGPDVMETKMLVTELGLQDTIFWVPKTSRKNLMWILSKVNIGVGEFIQSPRMLWGGTGWEVLACGKPLLQGFYFENGEFENLFGYSEPPLLKVKHKADILKHLQVLSENPEKCQIIGQASRDWFNQYNGIKLAEQWLHLLTK